MVVLATPDVTVTNQKDKTTQIARLKVFAENVKKVNMGGFKLVMTIERAVGKKPEGRTWKEEWVDAFVERKKLEDDEDYDRSDFEAGGNDSIEQMIKNLAATIKFMVDNGWPQEQAEAYALITGNPKAPLAAAVRAVRSLRRARISCATFRAAGQADDDARAARLLQPDRTIRPGDSGSGMGGAEAARRECRPWVCHQWRRHGRHSRLWLLSDDKGFTPG